MRQRQTILDYTGVARATSACESIRILPRTMRSENTETPTVCHAVTFVREEKKYIYSSME